MSRTTHAMRVRIFVCLVALLSFAIAAPGVHNGRAGAAALAAPRLKPVVQKIDYTFFAAAPMFYLDDGYEATIYLRNNSDGEVDVELSVTTNDAARPNEPSVYVIQAGKAATVNLADLMTPTDLGIGQRVVGGLLARYNAEAADSLSGRIVLSRFGEKQTFAVPLLNANPTGPMPYVRYAPVVDFTAGNDTMIAMQNLSDEPAIVEMTLHLQTDPQSPIVDVPVPAVVVEPWRPFVANLTPLAATVPSASWGSIEVISLSPKMVYHAVTISPNYEFAYDSEFVDPRSSVSTTKVLTPIVLDYDSASISYGLARNVSTTAKSITAVLTSPVNTTTLSFTVPAGAQRLFQIAAQSSLPPGGHTSGDVRVSYSGSPGDIVIGAVNISTAQKYAVGARTVEPSTSPGRRLATPYFSLESQDLAVVQLTNLGSTAALVGAKLVIADVGANQDAASRTTALVSVPALGTAVLNLKDVLNDMPDDFAARGSLEIVHNRAAGSIVASYYSTKALANVQVAALQPVASLPACSHLLSFPSHVTVLPSGSVQVAMVSDGTVATPGVRTEDGGTATPATLTAPNVYTTTYTAPSAFTSVARMVSYNQATQQVYECGGTSVDSIALELQQNPPTRLNPDGGTPFTLTAKGNRRFPAGVDMYVIFSKNDKSVMVGPIQQAQELSTLMGFAPDNDQFVGEITLVRVEDEAGNKITKVKQNPGFYYAFDPPSIEMSAEPSELNRAGGFVEISGSGFRKFGSDDFPKVSIGEISFTVTDVSKDGTKISGNLGRALYDIDTCETSAPCRRIRVTNPGGRTDDRAQTLAPSFKLNSGPMPVANGYKFESPTASDTAAGIRTIIVGTDLWNLRAVTFGSSVITYDLVSSISIQDDEVSVVVPSSCQTGSRPVTIADIDNAFTNNQVPGGWFYFPTHVAPLGGDLDGLPMFVNEGTINVPPNGPYTAIYRTGPRDCGVLLDADPQTGNIEPANCGTWRVIVAPLTNTTWSVTVILDALQCNVNAPVSRSINFKLMTTEQNAEDKTIGMTYTVLP